MIADGGKARLMLKLFDTISVGGVLATVVEVHNEHAFEIEFHDEREDRVATLDLQPKLAVREELHNT